MVASLVKIMINFPIEDRLVFVKGYNPKEFYVGLLLKGAEGDLSERWLVTVSCGRRCHFGCGVQGRGRQTVLRPPLVYTVRPRSVNSTKGSWKPSRRNPTVPLFPNDTFNGTFNGVTNLNSVETDVIELLKLKDVEGAISSTLTDGLDSAIGGFVGAYEQR